MAEFGQALLRERERRALPRVAVARATGIYIHHLAALEHGDFGALPDERTVEGFVRTYADYLSLDVEALVDDYRRARPEPGPAEPRTVVEEPELPPPAAVPADGPAPATAPPPAARPRFGRPLVLTAVVAGCVLAGGWWLMRDEPTADPAAGVAVRQNPAGTRAAGSAPPGPEAAGAAPADPVTGEPPPTGAEPADPGPTTAAAALSVPDYGVGTGVDDHRLVGRAVTFPAGSRVWFWTRVRGGEPGSRIRHVWLFDGRVVESIRLRVGSSNWRTQSAKTLQAAGRWAVEARTEDGAVLARSEFTAAE